MREPKKETQIPAKSIKITDTMYEIDWKHVPAVLSLKDISWERAHQGPCLVRKSLSKLGYAVEPELWESLGDGWRAAGGSKVLI